LSDLRKTQLGEKLIYASLFIGGRSTNNVGSHSKDDGRRLAIHIKPEKLAMTSYHPFRSAKAKARYLTFYDVRAQRWPVESKTRFVDTAFGQTFVRISGPADAPVLVLLHGGGGDSLHWIPNIEALSKSFTVYAVDNIYDYSRSIYTRIPKTSNDFVVWLNELFDALELSNHINLMGLSYGGWLAGQYALHFADRLDKTVMVAPGGTVLPLRLQWIMRAIFSLVPHRYFIKNFLFWFLEDLALLDEAGRLMLEEEVDAAVLRLKCFQRIRFPNPTVLNDAELKSFKMPVLYLVGEYEKMFSARKAIQRLHRVAPHIKTEIVPDAGHALTIVKSAMVNSRVIEFLNQR
jgi:pimeloyl-ACP methyl ester carboxylesterase